MSKAKPTYQQLERRLAEIEPIIEALKNHEVDAVVGEGKIAFLLLKEVEEALVESEKGFRAMFDLSGVGMVQADTPDFRLTRVNPRVCAMMGYSAEELLTKTWLEPTHPEDRQRDMKELTRVLRGKADWWAIEKRCVRKDGSMIWVNVHGTALRNDAGRVIRIVAMIEDVTARKQAEVTLQQTVEELKRSNEDLAQFAYVASHDLQEPLRQVTGFMGLLRDRYKGKLDEKADEYIHYAVDGASRMSHLITDLLTYSRIVVSSKQPGVISCQKALDLALANLGAAISESGARVTHDTLPTVVADNTLIVQLFQNLVGNALKFRREGVDPEIHVGARREDDRWVLWVRDNGIGIPTEQFDRVFTIFQRLQTREKYPGTGIGLAICKKIVDQHGGRMWVESKVGEGSTIYFAL